MAGTEPRSLKKAALELAMLALNTDYFKLMKRPISEFAELLEIAEEVASEIGKE